MRDSGTGASNRRIQRDAKADTLDRIRRKAVTDPGTARRAVDSGWYVSTATDIATRTAVSVGVAVGSGWGSSACFWDPYDSWWDSCGYYWRWWCSPSWSWWWSSCAMPWWGCGWGFGYWSSHWSFWYGGWPSYCYYPRPYYAPYPVYYSTVIYDTYDPPPVREVVYVEQPVVAGEGAIEVASTPDVGTLPSATSGRGSLLASTSQLLALGDQAFREGRYSDSVHYYAKAVDLEPGQGVLHLILSDALFATGDYHYAAYALRRALELDPTLVDSVVDKHAFYSDPADFDRQIELLERYLGDHFLDDDARLLLAANYLFAGRPAQAADLLRSPFSVAVRESGAGRVLLERAESLRGVPDTTTESPR